MTREEAIAFFEDMNECTYGNLEAVEMAIEALKQEPCDDAVSRQSVHDWIDEKLYSFTIWTKTDAHEQINALPPVLPKREQGAIILNGNMSVNNTKEMLMLRAMNELEKPKRERGEWISVSERFPTKEEHIANNGLFIVSDGNRTYAEYFDIYNSKKYFGEPTMNGFRVDRCVIAWMPLPEPYKTESEVNT